MVAPVDKMLLDMLRFKRPAWSLSEEIFIEKFLADLPNFYQDDFGNVIIEVGDDPNICWSSHTDTVHTNEGDQELKVEGPWITAVTGEKRELSNCLGADCAAGVWLMVKMIEAEIPGLYIFHRDEESGGKGSKWIAKNTPQVLLGIDYCIALDRKDYESVITHQRGSRCCSQDFADALCGILGNNFKPDKTGVFTDSANYTDLVGECTNISVGYFSQHGPLEKQNWIFLQHLLEVIKSADFGLLIQRRMAGDPDPDKPVYGSYKPYRSDYDSGPLYERGPIDLEDYVFQYYGTTARFLEWLGIKVEDIQEFKREHPYVPALPAPKSDF